MPNEANVAPLNVFDFAPRDQAERRAVQNLFDRLAKQIAALESRKANKFAAREEVAIRSQGEETSAASAGGNIAHQPAGGRRENGDQDVGEIGDHELAPGFAVNGYPLHARGAIEAAF